MLSASARCLIRLAPAPRDGSWRRVLVACTEVAAAPSARRNYSAAQQKIVRVNGRKSAPGPRLSSTHAPPPAPPAAQPPPPPPPPSAFPWSYVVGAVAVVGSATGIYYYSNLQGDKEKEEVQQPKKGGVVRVPARIEELPESVQYLLVGGGTASFAAFRAIKSNQPKAQILVVSEEDSLPYMRPPLSKEIWRNTELPELDSLSFQQWNGNRRSLYYESGAFYADVSALPTLENGGVGVARGYRVTRLDPSAHEAVVSAPGQPDRTIKYGKCLVATGVRPNNVRVLEEGPARVRERCVLLRTVRDAARLWARLETARDVVLVGGGFLGSEVACALAADVRGRGARVTQVFREGGVLAHILPDYLARWTTAQLRKLGVNILTDSEITRAYMKGDRVALELSTGETLEADVVVVGAGSTPNTELAAASGLETHPDLGGLLVNAELQARTDLYAAGDVACFYDPALGRRRVEHHDHAVVSGRLAGENMAGAAPPRHYRHQSMFWSDLGPEIGLEAIGIIDSSLPTVGVFADASAQTEKSLSSAAGGEGGESGESEASLQEPGSKYDKGVVFYMEGRRVVGVLMWNLFNRMAVARQLLLQGEEYDDLNEVAKLFQLHKE